MIKYCEASAHGRFQPLHNGHMEYLLAAKAQCDFMWIGIAWYDPVSQQFAHMGERERPENNPLTYHERVKLITEALIDTGARWDEFCFVPFPIENPARIPNFIPITIPCLTTICEPWNREKIARLQAVGYEVIVLYEKEIKEITGQIIRDDIRLGGSIWRSLVPPATVRAVEALGVRDRLVRLKGSDTLVS